MTLLQKAIHRLKNEQLSCIAYKGEFEYISIDKGLRPLLKPLRENPNFFKDTIVIDRIIGKSAAFLLIKGKINSLHAITLSQHALTLLEKHKIPVTYENLVPYVINATQTGMCPMEATVIEIEDVEEAYLALINKVNELMANK